MATASTYGLGVVLSLTDKFSDVASRIKARFQNLRETIERESKSIDKAQTMMANGAKTMAAGLVGLTSLGFAVKQFADFESGMAKAFINIPDASMTTKKGFQDLTKEAIRMGLSVEDATDTMFKTISAGFNDLETARPFFTTVIKGAVANSSKAGDTLLALSKTLESFQIPANRAAEVMDKIAASAQFGQMNMAELASALPLITGTAKSAGLSLNELLAAMAALSKTTQSPSQAATALQQLISNIQKPSDEALKTAEKLKIAFSFKALKTMGLTKFMDQLRQAAGKSEEDLVNLFGSVEALKALFPLVSTGVKSYTTALEGMDHSAGLVDKQLEIMRDTLTQMGKELKGSLTVDLIEFGEQLRSIVSAVAGVLKNLAQRFAALSPDTKRFIGQMVLAGSLILVTAGALITFGGALKIAAIGAAALGLSLGWVFLIGAVLVAAVLVVIKFRKQIADAFGPFVEGFSRKFKPAIQEVGKALGLLWDAVARIGSIFGAVFSAVEGLISRLAGQHVDLWNILGRMAGWLLNAGIVAFVFPFKLLYGAFDMVTVVAKFLLQTVIMLGKAFVYVGKQAVSLFKTGHFSSDLNGQIEMDWDKFAKQYEQGNEDLRAMFDDRTNLFKSAEDASASPSDKQLDILLPRRQIGFDTSRESLTSVGAGLSPEADVGRVFRGLSDFYSQSRLNQITQPVGASFQPVMQAPSPITLTNKIETSIEARVDEGVLFRLMDKRDKTNRVRRDQ